MISNEAIEAAHKAWREQAAMDGSIFEYNLRAAIEAAAQIIAAEAWDEGSISGWVESGLPHSWHAENSLRNSNPYRPTK